MPRKTVQKREHSKFNDHDYVCFEIILLSPAICDRLMGGACAICSGCPFSVAVKTDSHIICIECERLSRNFDLFYRYCKTWIWVCLTSETYKMCRAVVLVGQAWSLKNTVLFYCNLYLIVFNFMLWTAHTNSVCCRCC